MEAPIAAIDFPASPTVGQLFSAANGVTYSWSGTLWLVQAGPGGGTGDFSAYNNANYSIASSGLTLVVFNAVRSGNAGNWYSVSTGRYTPPAGRFFIDVTISGATGAGGSAGTLQAVLYKNGAALQLSNDFVNSNFSWASANISVTVDANGSDYFEVFATSVAGTTANATAMSFTAFPLTGMQGPPGPPFGGGTGDFSASIATLVPSTTPAVATGWTVNTGNSGGWLTTSTGAYRPPAGRVQMTAQAQGANAVSAYSLALNLRKNGTVVYSTTTSSAGANAWAAASVEGTFDVNGTDILDVTIYNNVATNVGPFSWSAFPLTGMQGPAGPAGIPLAQNAQTGSYTLVLADANGHLYHAVAAAAATYTIPDNGSVPYPIGTTLSFVNDSTNNVTIAITTDTLVLSPGTTTGSRTLATGGVATAIKVTSTRWLINGTGLT
jgi:hypothetical protein